MEAIERAESSKWKALVTNPLTGEEVKIDVLAAPLEDPDKRVSDALAELKAKVAGLK